MKKWILVMLCAFLYVMPVHATELNNGEAGVDAPSEEAVVEESGDSVVEEVEQSQEEAQSVAESEESSQEEAQSTPESIPESSSAREEVSSEPASSVEATSENVEGTTEEVTVEEVVTEEEVTTEEETTEAAIIEIPDVVGMTEEDAVVALGAIVFEDGSVIEIIKEYKYTDVAEVNMVYEQTLYGEVPVEEAKQVTICISLGIDPNETIVEGITEPLNQTITSAYGIDWENQPSVYEYNWDNSENCWVRGVYVDGVRYITPEGTYNTNVRHKIQLYTDGTYVYTHIIFSRDYEAAANGNWFQYFVDGNMAAFQIEQYNGTDLAHNNLSPGTYQVVVRHADSSGSYTVADGASAYYTVFDSQVNAHLEMRIPISELVEQNEKINADSFGTIEFFTPNLMLGRLTAAGASTFPFAMAAIAFAVIPGTALVLNKKKKTMKKDSNVQ